MGNPDAFLAWLPACGRGFAAIPNRLLGEGCVRGPLRGRARGEMVWVLLPKQKDLVCRGDTLHLIIKLLKRFNLIQEVSSHLPTVLPPYEIR